VSSRDLIRSIGERHGLALAGAEHLEAMLNAELVEITWAEASAVGGRARIGAAFQALLEQLPETQSSAASRLGVSLLLIDAVAETGHAAGQDADTRALGLNGPVQIRDDWERLVRLWNAAGRSPARITRFSWGPKRVDENSLLEATAEVAILGASAPKREVGEEPLIFNLVVFREPRDGAFAPESE
jgi:hypothetical protein